MSTNFLFNFSTLRNLSKTRLRPLPRARRTLAVLWMAACMGGCAADDGAVEDDDDGEEPTIALSPVNVAQGDSSACHDAMSALPEGVVATCVGPGTPTVDDADAYCDAGPQPFGTLVYSVVDGDKRLYYCNTGADSGATWFVRADGGRHALVIGATSGGSTQVTALALSAGSASYGFGCDPPTGFGRTVFDTTAVPVGELKCGPATVMQAEAGQAPVVRVSFSGETVDLEMALLE